MKIRRMYWNEAKLIWLACRLEGKPWLAPLMVVANVWVGWVIVTHCAADVPTAEQRDDANAFRRIYKDREQ